MRPDPPQASDGVRLELLRPREIEAALARRSVVYVPLGAVEWHSAHLPVGLDGLTAHGICIRAAEEHGGLVYPPLWFGTGGGHGAYPWTVMMPDAAAIMALLDVLLHRLATFGVARAVLFSGHFADEQLEMIATVADAWAASALASSSPMTVIARGINMATGLAIAPDHAGLFETTMLAGLRPDRVAIDELPLLDPARPLTDDLDDARHEPSHPLWGVFGPDPRRFDPEAAPALLAAAATWLASEATV